MKFLDGTRKEVQDLQGKEVLVLLYNSKNGEIAKAIEDKNGKVYGFLSWRVYERNKNTVLMGIAEILNKAHQTKTVFADMEMFESHLGVSVLNVLCHADITVLHDADLFEIYEECFC